MEGCAVCHSLWQKLPLEEAYHHTVPTEVPVRSARASPFLCQTWVWGVSWNATREWRTWTTPWVSSVRPQPHLWSLSPLWQFHTSCYNLRFKLVASQSGPHRNGRASEAIGKPPWSTLPPKLSTNGCACCISCGETHTKTKGKMCRKWMFYLCNAFENSLKYLANWKYSWLNVLRTMLGPFTPLFNKAGAELKAI